MSEFLDLYSVLYEPHHEQTCFIPYANNKDADQPVHPCSLIIIFVVHFLERKIPVLAESKISRLWLASVAEPVSLSLAWLLNPKDRFSCDVAQL